MTAFKHTDPELHKLFRKNEWLSMRPDGGWFIHPQEPTRNDEMGFWIWTDFLGNKSPGNAARLWLQGHTIEPVDDWRESCIQIQHPTVLATDDKIVNNTWYLKTSDRQSPEEIAEVMKVFSNAGGTVRAIDDDNAEFNRGVTASVDAINKQLATFTAAHRDAQIIVQREERGNAITNAIAKRNILAGVIEALKITKESVETLMTKSQEVTNDNRI